MSDSERLDGLVRVVRLEDDDDENDDAATSAATAAPLPLLALTLLPLLAKVPFLFRALLAPPLLPVVAVVCRLVVIPVQIT